tara:strand:- start:101 stop:604 length:504 start_codon:yes stop_codon:yes gene_type:complete
MWAIARVKKNEINVFKEKLSLKFENKIQFYVPKISCHKYIKNKLKKFEKDILEGYIFCHHSEFSKSSIVNQIKFVTGLKYFLSGYIENQNEIKNFIINCKSYENENGYIKPVFFKDLITKKAKFISGPLTNVIFEIISREKKRLKVLIGNIETTISDNKSYLYSSIN